VNPIKLTPKQAADLEKLMEECRKERHPLLDLDA